MNATALEQFDPPVTASTPDAGQRDSEHSRDDAGSLVVADQVVEKVAGHAVTLVAGASAAPRRVLGMNVGAARPSDAASVSADVQEGVASVQATIAVKWPRSVQAVADEVRQRIRHEVSSMTGVRVDHVDVEVVSMTLPTSAPRVI